MSEVREVSFRPGRERTLWSLVASGAAGAGLTAAGPAFGLPAGWTAAGVLLTVLGALSLHVALSRVSADAHGLHVRTLLRRWSVPWDEVADLRVQVRHGRWTYTRRVHVVLRGGRRRNLPLPAPSYASDPYFDGQLDALRALHRRHGAPQADHLAVLSFRTAGRGSAWPAALLVVLLAGAGLATWAVPGTAATARAWRSATPCTAATQAADRDACLTTVPGVISRTEAHQRQADSWLYFTHGEPVGRVRVSRAAARGFAPGDKVELSLWRGGVREVAGAHFVWREHVPGGQDVAIVAAGLLLLAGWPAAQLLLHLRGRRLPDDDVLPSVIPFTVVLAVTGCWLLPLCYLHPTAPPSSPGGVAWAASGALLTLGLLAWAWRATRIRRPDGRLPDPAPEGGDPHEEIFLAARFLDATDYNPYGNFGTHVVLGGDEPPAVLPHGGPGRFAAKPLPLGRLTVGAVRRPRGGDGEDVPRSWHVAELDDAGTPVRLAAAPTDLSRILQAVSTGHDALMS